MSARTVRLGLYARSIASVIAVIVVWEAAALLHLLPPFFLPAFSTVMVQLWSTIQDGTLFADLGLSLYRAFCGLLLATVAGTLIGIAMARTKAVYWLFDPFVALGFPSPKIAFLPVFVLWFGIDSLSKVLLVAFACVFPIIIATYNAARSINRLLLWSAYSLGTGRFAALTRIILPACFPRIVASMRVALPVSLITTFTSEMVAGGGGMGATLMYSQRFFESPTVFAYIVVMLAVGLVIDALMLKIQDWIPAAKVA